MKLTDILFNIKNRLELVDSFSKKKIVDGFYYSTLCGVRSLIRGGIVGGLGGYLLSGGNLRTTFTGAVAGASIDFAQHGIRTINLISLSVRNPLEYSNHIKKYEELNII
ncbi:MAG: hypothetical protein KJ949_00835 [Nanoarchaeota archaeon]|nr:hypothetical protein [Nanoarchaeota archaeon]